MIFPRHKVRTMRFFTGLFLAAFFAGCAVQPLDLHVPEDHPANPKAVSAPPSDITSDYEYVLPANPVSLGECGHTASSHKDHPVAPPHEATGDMPNEAPPKTHGGSHAH